MITISNYSYEILFLGLVSVLLLLAYTLYFRPPAGVAYLRTGLGAPKVLLEKGGLVIPLVHSLTPVRLQTYSQELALQDSRSLLTKECLRVDMRLLFNVRVSARHEGILTFVRMTGGGELQAETLASLLAAEASSVLQTTVAILTLESLHQHRHDFIETVNRRLGLQLQKFGLEMVSTALISLRQTDKVWYDPAQVMDAKGLLLLEKTQLEQGKQRHMQQLAADAAFRRRDLEAALERMACEREALSARLQQFRFKAEAGGVWSGQVQTEHQPVSLVCVKATCSA